MGGNAMNVAGLGFRAGADLAALSAALDLAEARAGVPAQLLAVPQAKADAPVLRALAAARGLDLRAVGVDGIATPTHSARVAARFGTGSVAEAAALVAAGPQARLVVRRVVSPCGQATAALAVSGQEWGSL